MGLKNVINILGFLTILSVTSCALKKLAMPGVKTPADRVENETFRFDCCDPSINQGTKELCKMAASDADTTLFDGEGNKYVFTWSDCRVGEERWRQWEN